MNFELSIGLLLVAVVVSRVVAERALKVLSADEKARLLDAFSGVRAFNLVPLIVIFGAYYFAMEYTTVSYQTIYIAYAIALTLFITVSFFATQSKLNTLELPPKYLRLFGISRVIQYSSVGLFMAVFFSNVL